MSSSTAIALVIASVFPGVFVFMHISKMAYDVGSGVAAGVIGGSPVSTRYRWLMLYQYWVPYVAAAVACGFMIAAVNVEIAAQATDAGIETVAYLGAFFGALASMSWLLASVTEFLHYRSVLRQAEAD